ncbi:hypothetical protein [Staphylococcus simulans]|uniref:hypothetical protein n=1 Tax=Staphylococcus simulans TaxID=1286 RepID=UPI000D1DEB98|nr:hypothetical protein [Staphylococcus simulans]MDY5060981.1 hypothetical protein [Staphylococcus simulans]PTJ18947.1 hypothetical protein BU038_04145 [Staphylococcus simulans]
MNLSLVKRVADIVTIVSFIALLVLLSINFYFNVQTNGFSAGFKIESTTNIIFVSLLFAICLVSDIISTVLKRKLKYKH